MTSQPDDRPRATDASGVLRRPYRFLGVMAAGGAAFLVAGVDLPDGRRGEHAYDPLGRRVEARVFEAHLLRETARLAEQTRFVWDGDSVAHAVRKRAAAEGDIVVEERTFAFEDGSFVPWAQRDDVPDGYSGRRHSWAFLLVDPIGTPEELVGPDGAVLAEMDRQAWGKTGATAGARAETPLRFQGQLEDPETGLHYNRFRYYDPEAGLYISPEPIGLEGGLRSFGYGLNPVRWVDPLGLAVFVVDPNGQCAVLGTKDELKAMRVKDGHHIVQDAAVRGLPGYTYGDAPAIGLPGPSTAAGSPHYRATQAQRTCTGVGGDLGQELAVGDHSLRAAGASPDIAGTATDFAKQKFASMALGPSTSTRIPGTRR